MSPSTSRRTPNLVRFAARRGDPERAEEVAAEAFTIAWRRVVDLPRVHGEARAWLFGIARNLLLSQHRHESRAVSVRLSDPACLPGLESSPEDVVVATVDLAIAWTRLTAIHQEALSLAIWEGLSGSQAAAVLGISPVAYRIRLSRARRALSALLAVRAATPQTQLTSVVKGRNDGH